MNIFEKIPDNFFSILSSKNKNIYGLALVTLYDALSLYRTRIRKVDYLELLKSRGENEINLLTYEEDTQEEFSKFIEPTFNNKVNLILKRLIDTGWIYIEHEIKTGCDYILLPSYSISMLKLLYEFIDQEKNKYISYVHTTYSDLKVEDENQDDYIYRTLENAFYSTKNLEIEVTKLDHSIRVFHKQLANIFDPNQVLVQHFDHCREDVVDPIYHPLKTSDSIVLYNGPITAILKRWLNTPQVLDKLVEQCLKDNNLVKNEREAQEDIVKKINFIQDTYNRLSLEIEEIDKTQASYTKASTEKVIYLNNNDKSIKGKLETIFLSVAKTLNNEKGTSTKILKDINNSIRLYQQGYIDSSSLQRPYKRNLRMDSDPMAIDDFEHESNEGLMQSLLSIVDQYSDEKVMEFMGEAFEDNKTINIKDINLNDIEDFIMVILGTVKVNSRRSFYEIKRADPMENLDIREYNVPNYDYIRKEGN